MLVAFSASPSGGDGVVDGTARVLAAGRGDGEGNQHAPILPPGGVRVNPGDEIGRASCRERV